MVATNFTNFPKRGAPKTAGPYA